MNIGYLTKFQAASGLLVIYDKQSHFQSQAFAKVA